MAKYKIIPSSRTIVQSPISIGHKAEKGVEAIEFDLTAWVETYGSGTATIVMKRWGDSIPYPVALEIDENNKATWTLSDIDTAKAGMAYAQLSYVVGDEVVKKSDIYTFRVMDSLTGEGDPPEAYESWLEHLTHFAAEAMAEVLDIEGIVTDKTLTVDGGIADAKATGDALSALEDAVTEETDKLKDDLGDIRTPSGINLFNPDALIENTFLNGTTGLPETNSNYWATDFIPVDGTYTVRAFEYSGMARTRVYMYDSNKVYDSRVVVPPESFPRGYTFTWTGYVRINIDNGNNAAYEDPNKYLLIKGLNTDNVAVNFIPYYTAYDRTARNVISWALKGISATGITDANDITDVCYSYLSSSLVAHLPGAGAWYLWTVKHGNSNLLQLAYEAHGTKPYLRAMVNGTWWNWEKIGKEAAEDALAVTSTSTIALFPSVGCCGDSFTAGYLYNKTDSQWYDPDYVPNGEYPAIGYPAVMGRLYGIDVTPYAKGGLTSTAYRTDSKGLPALLADDPKYLYIIALGLNDKTQNVPLGVGADIDTEPSTPTYLGNMGYIIRQIKAHAPYARIILCKSLWMNNDYYNYISSGVELLSSHLGVPYIETKGDAYFESDYYKNGLKGLHPTAPLYAGIGKRMGELVGKCVIENPQYFYNFYVPN